LVIFFADDGEWIEYRRSASSAQSNGQATLAKHTAAVAGASSIPPRIEDEIVAGDRAAFHVIVGIADIGSGGYQAHHTSVFRPSSAHPLIRSASPLVWSGCRIRTFAEEGSAPISYGPAKALPAVARTRLIG
jgi:hypothetical protein